MLPSPPRSCGACRSPKSAPAGMGQDPNGAWWPRQAPCFTSRSSKHAAPTQISLMRCPRAQRSGTAPTACFSSCCALQNSWHPPLFHNSLSAHTLLKHKAYSSGNSLWGCRGDAHPGALRRAGESPGSPRGFAPLGEMQSVSIHRCRQRFPKPASISPSSKESPLAAREATGSPGNIHPPLRPQALPSRWAPNTSEPSKTLSHDPRLEVINLPERQLASAAAQRGSNAVSHSQGGRNDGRREEGN